MIVPALSHDTLLADIHTSNANDDRLRLSLVHWSLAHFNTSFSSAHDGTPFAIRSRGKIRHRSC